MKKYAILLAAFGVFQSAVWADHICTCPKLLKADSSIRGARTIYSTQHMDLSALSQSSRLDESSDMQSEFSVNEDVEYNSENFERSQGTPGDNVVSERKDSDDDSELEAELDWDD